MDAVELIQVHVHSVEYRIVVAPAADEGLGLDRVVTEIESLSKIGFFTGSTEVWHDSSLDTAL